MSVGKAYRSNISSGSDIADEPETRSGLWWSMAEFATLAAVALAAGVIIFYVRWPAESSQTAMVQPAANSPAFHESAATGRILLEFANNDDLQRVSGFQSVRELLIEDSNITDDGLVHLQKLTELEHLKIRGAAITDQGIDSICQLKKLRYLNLPQANFTNTGLAKLAQLPELEMLRFGTPHVTDEGLAQCVDMQRLRFLHLINVPVTDDGLEELRPVTQLQSLYLDGTKVSEQGLARLLDALPDLHVHLDQRHLDRDPRASSHAHYVP